MIGRVGCVLNDPKTYPLARRPQAVTEALVDVETVEEAEDDPIALALAAYC